LLALFCAVAKDGTEVTLSGGPPPRRFTDGRPPPAESALPEIVFVPAHPQVRDGRKDVVFEVRQLADGRRVLPVFTTTEHLIAALGPRQPWAALPLRAELRRIRPGGAALSRTAARTPARAR